MRWLVVSPYLPHPAIGHGGGTAVLQLCRTLRAEHDVTLLCFRREDEHGLEKHLEEHGVRTVCVPFTSNRAEGISRLGLYADRALAALRARRHGRPLMVEKYDREEFRGRLEALIEELDPDVIQVEYGFMAPAARLARELVAQRGGKTVVLLNTHEIATLPRQRRLAAATSSGERRKAQHELDLWAEHESSFADVADRILCVTEQDRELLATLTEPNRLRTVPLGVEVSSLPVATTSMYPPPRLLFVGSFGHPPNVEAAISLCRDIMPKVWQSRPEAVADIVGANAPDELRDLAEQSGGKILLQGYVESLDEHFDASWAFVAPLFSGGGIKIKILEAMARGSAVITTPIGAEGIDEDGHATAIAGDVDEIVEQILRVIREPAYRLELGVEARNWAVEHFDCKTIVRKLAATVEECRSI